MAGRKGTPSTERRSDNIGDDTTKDTQHQSTITFFKNRHRSQSEYIYKWPTRFKHLLGWVGALLCSVGLFSSLTNGLLEKIHILACPTQIRLKGRRDEVCSTNLAGILYLTSVLFALPEIVDMSESDGPD